MTRSPLTRLRLAFRHIAATGEAVHATSDRIDVGVEGLRGEVARLTHRVYESAGIVDDIRAIVGDTLPHLRQDEEKRIARLVDAVNYATRRQPLTRERTRVLFLVHHVEAWDSLDGVVRALRETPDFEVLVASIPRHFRGSDGFVDEDLVHQELVERGIPHLRMRQRTDADRLDVVRALSPDVIFRQSQWDADVPEAYSTRNLGFARLCFISYEMIGFIKNLPEDDIDNTAIDTRYHRSAWRVFCSSPLVKEIASRDGALGGEQFVVTGHPKADRLRSAEPLWPIQHDDASEPRARVVWSAHHSLTDAWISFGMAHLVAEGMLEWARSSPHVDFVLMPHPALRPFINDPSSPVAPEQADAFVEEWCSLPNATIFRKGDYAPVLAASDVLIVDGVSLLVEYQFQGKPLIFLERPGHRDFNEIGTVVMTGVHPVPDLKAARDVVEGFLAGEPDPLADQQRWNMEKLFGTAPAVPQIVEALRAAVAEDRGATRNSCDSLRETAHRPENPVDETY